MKKVKTCVYAIALNEIQFVDRFMEHSKEADLVLVCDTGSTDGTVERLRELGAVVYEIVQKPWRFDVPRNTALSLVPDDIDICLSIDLDEFLQPGWSNAIDKVWQERNGDIKRIAYDYIWNWTIDGKPDIRFYADKIHHRNEYKWCHPCHETLYYVGEGPEVKVTIPEVVLEHHADKSKSRRQYLGLLKTGIEENPNNDRMRHYYARELFFNGKWSEAIEEFLIHLNLPSSKWSEERAASYRYISKCYGKLGNHHESQLAALKGTIECPHPREPWLELARASHYNKDWHTCFYAATKCIGITHRTTTYMSDSSVWGFEPYDLAALSAYYLGYYDQSIEYGNKALELNQNDGRLHNNLKFYTEKLNNIR